MTEATGSHCLQGDMIQKACGREGNESIVGGNSRIADIKNAPSVGLMFVYENRRWCEQSFQIGGLRGQLYQLPSEFQHHPESVHPTQRYSYNLPQSKTCHCWLFNYLQAVLYSYERQPEEEQRCKKKIKKLKINLLPSGVVCL